MPKLCEFFGIAIYIHWRDHGPSHFHAEYAGDEASVSIEDLAVVRGKLPPRALGLVMEWASLHQGELRTAWTQAKELKPVTKIEPLG
jgi:hypothetical protein